MNLVPVSSPIDEISREEFWKRGSLAERITNTRFEAGFDPMIVLIHVIQEHLKYGYTGSTFIVCNGPCTVFPQRTGIVDEIAPMERLSSEAKRLIRDLRNK